MHNFKELKIWQKAVDLAADIYALTSNSPEGEKFNLVSQMRRAAISISSNIAEGAGRGTNKYFARFLSIAYGSLYELESQLFVSKRLNFTKENKLYTNIDELQKMIYDFKKTLK